MRFLKKSLAVLLACAMMIGTLSVAASAWTPADDGNELTIVHEFFRYDETSGKWVATEKAAPGEKVKLRAFVTTDYYTNSSTAALFFDNRFFTIIDKEGDKPVVDEVFETGTNKNYLGLKATDNNSQWYTKDSTNFIFNEVLQKSEKVPNILNGELNQQEPTIALKDFVKNYNAVKSVIYFASSPYNTKLDGTDYLYEYTFEVNNTDTVKTPGNKGTVCLPKEVAANSTHEMLFNFPKGPKDGHEDAAQYMGNGWTPVINNNIATISVFNDVILDANGGVFTEGTDSETTHTISGVIGTQVTGISEKEPERTGYALTGWSLTPDGAALTDAELAELKYGYEEDGITLYAVWAKTDTFYTVELYEMKTDGTYGTPISKEVPSVEGTKIDYPAVPQTGFHLDETQDNQTSITVAGDNSSVVKVYYARDTYTATYHFTDEAGERTDEVPVLYGAAIPEFSAVPGGPMQEGYEFKGWSTDKDKLVTVPTSMPAEDIDLYPIFGPIVYTYYFDADGGKLLNKDNEEVETLTVLYNHGDTPSFPANPVKPGYEFIEWDNILPETVTEDMDFAAIYNQEVYTVKFMDGDTVKYQTTAFYGDVLGEDIIPEGYKVNAWTLNDTTEVAEFPYTVTSNVTFRATDDALVYDAIFYMDDGVTEYDRTQAIVDTEVKAPAQNPTKYGYNFIMWDPMVEGTVMEEGGLSFVATFEIADFDIIFYDEDGKTVLKEETRTFGDSLTDLQSYEPEKAGYTFQKWSKEIPAEMPGEDIKVTASWIANDNTFNFYDADGTTLVNYITAKTDEEVTLPAYPVVDGYNYTGWTMDDGKTCAAGDVIVMPAGGGSFKAEREPATVTITLDANGGTLKGDSTITAQYGADIKAPETPDAPEGSTFLGWSTSATGAAGSFPATMPAKDATYYAIWETNKHLATFDGNGSKIKGSDSEVYATLVEYGKEIPFPELEGIDGYEFAGWTPSTTTMPNEPVKFVAQWKYIPTGNADYTIYIYTVNPANPAEYIETVQSGTTKDGNIISIVADDATAPEGTVVTIDYEGLNLAESNVPDVANAKNVLSIKAVEGEKNELVAYFKLASFTATFDIDKDTTITSGEATVTGTWGSTLTAPTLEKEGWKHTGWTPSVPATLKETATYTPVWEQINADVIFTIDGEEFDRENYNYGETIVPPTAPAKPGYTFKWDIADGAKMGEEEITVTGSYTAIDYTVSYVISENKPGATVPAGETEKNINDVITLATPEEKAGYTFVGWDYNNATYAPGTKFTMPAANVTFTGKYVAKNFTIRFDTKGGEFIDNMVVPVGSELTLPSAKDTSGNKNFLYWTDGNNNYTPNDVFTMPASDVKLEAVWDTIESSVTVDYTGDVPEGVNDYSLGVKEAGSTFALPEFPEAVDGYTFDGWYIDNAKYGEGASFTMPNKAVTIKGEWTKNEVPPVIETYTLTLNAQGGAFDNGQEIYTAEFEADQAITTTPGDPDKSGYRFIGWKDANGSTTSVPETMPANDVTLYAEWAELFNVSYKDGETSYGSFTDAAAEGDNLPAPTSIPKMDGYIFDKWVDEDTDEAVTSMPAKDLVLIPTWIPIDPIEFSVMYFDGTTALGTQTYKEGDTIVPLTAEEKPGYTFNGWKGMPEDHVMPAEDIAVFADYVAKTYKLTLDANGGKFADEALQFTADVAYNTVLSTIVPANPTRDGYTFKGWKDANTGAEATVPSTMPNYDISLKAEWDKTPTYTLTVDANGGKFANDSTEYTIVREEGKAIGMIEQPTREGGYTFKEWKIEAPEGVALNSIPDTMPGYDFKIVAQWNDPEPDKFVVTVNPNGGTFPDGTTATWTSEQLEEGATINNLPGEPKKDGYDFKGWLESTTGNILDTLPATVPGANTVYTAQWEEIVPEVKSHKINYYIVKGGALYESDEYKEGEDISFITPAANDIKGFEFIKWVDADGNDIDSKMGENDINAYAVLEAKKYTVTYMSEGKVFFQKTDVAYGSEVPKADTPTSSDPNKVFSKWTPDIPAQMPANDLTFTAEFIDVAPTEYKITFYVDGEVHFADFLAEGEKIETPKKPMKFGYKFVGWEPAVPDTMPANDLEFNAKFEKDDSFVTVIIGGAVIGGGVIGTLAGINAALITGAAIIGGILVIFGASQLVKHTFTVTYIVDGEVYKTYKVVEGTKIPVPADPAKDGAEFAGWEPEVPEKMPGNDLTFEATWESEIVDIPDTGSFAGVAAFATISAAAAAAYVITSRKKKED